MDYYFWTTPYNYYKSEQFCEADESFYAYSSDSYHVLWSVFVNHCGRKKAKSHTKTDDLNNRSFKWEKQLLIPLTIYQHSFWQPLLCYFMRMAWGWQIWHTGWQKIWRTYCTPYNCIKYKLFSSFFHSQNLEKIYTNAVTKDPTTPQMCCYATLWNVSVLKATIENKASVTINFMKLTTGNNVVFCLSYCLK